MFYEALPPPPPNNSNNALYRVREAVHRTKDRKGLYLRLLLFAACCVVSVRQIILRLIWCYSVITSIALSSTVSISLATAEPQYWSQNFNCNLSHQSKRNYIQSQHRNITMAQHETAITEQPAYQTCTGNKQGPVINKDKRQKPVFTSKPKNIEIRIKHGHRYLSLSKNNWQPIPIRIRY